MRPLREANPAWEGREWRFAGLVNRRDQGLRVSASRPKHPDGRGGTAAAHPGQPRESPIPPPPPRRPAEIASPQRNPRRRRLASPLGAVCYSSIEPLPPELG